MFLSICRYVINLSNLILPHNHGHTPTNKFIEDMFLGVFVTSMWRVDPVELGIFPLIESSSPAGVSRS